MGRTTGNKVLSKIVLGERLTPRQFLLTEAILFIAQTNVFLIAAVLMSGLLTQERALLEFVNAKVNQTTKTEFFAMLGALLATFGVLHAIAQGADRSSLKFLRRVADEVMLDAPRIVYASGSSVTAAALASGIFILNNPQIQAPRPAFWFFMAALLALFFFGLGAGLSYWLKRKTHIRLPPVTLP